MTFPRSNYARDAAAALTDTRDSGYGFQTDVLTSGEKAIVNAQLAAAYEQYTANLLTYALSLDRGNRQDVLLALVEQRLGIDQIGDDR